MSIKDYGAIGDGVADDTVAINDALAAGDGLVPPGVYRVTENIEIPDKHYLCGTTINDCIIFGDNITGGVIVINSGSYQKVQQLTIAGRADIALHVDTAAVDIDRVQTDPFYPGDFSTKFIDAFVFENTWGSSFTNLRTSPTDIREYCYICRGAFNTNMCQRWYTSNSRAIPGTANILVDGGHGSLFNMMTCQSKDIGLEVRSGLHHTFSQVYFEDNITPLVIGGMNSIPQGTTFQGMAFAGPPRQP